ncbi:hypothetical protein [Flavobacterium ginsenosidimutans]|uniref:Uncharacterized protein n=1 Tax=Flavobacterium ginsenosidimutans TaxID=687844 RepID=A0ABZ2Q2L1_9FLAO|nr:hypothetical protein [Flavobacterium ginsenosidimutans]KAF2326601.1 hypothetical protein DM444_22190 [Flavobacterium ginsenosidimutans]
MQTIKQRRLFTKREYNILDNKVNYKTSYVGGESEGMIAFENLSKEKTTYKTSNNIILLLSLFIFGITGISFYFRNDKDSDPDAWIAFAFIAIVLFTIYFFMNENSWKIRTYNNGQLLLFKKHPNKNLVDEFITTLFLERDNYLRERYLSLDPNLDYATQVNDLRWLLNVEVISKDEFDQYYSDLKLLYVPKRGTIGFDR